MATYSIPELQNLVEGSIEKIQKDLKPKAESYFPGAETTRFFDDRLKSFRTLHKELAADPKFSVHLLGSSQNGKSTLLNVLMGKQILTEGHVGACSAAVVRCQYADAAEYKMTVKYVDREVFLSMLGEGLKEAETVLEGEETPPEKRKEGVREALSRFIGFFKISEADTAEQTVQLCRKWYENPDSISFQDFGLTIDVPTDDQAQVDEHLAAKGKKAFVVEDCLLQGPFPEWHPNMELIDMPGTNDADAFRTQVTENVKKKVAGVMFITRGTQLGCDIIRWFKETPILAEVAESTERNQQRVFVVRTVIDEQLPFEVPEDAESLWPFLKGYCADQEQHFRNQIISIVHERFSDPNLVAKLLHFVEHLPVHFVSAKVFRNLDTSSLRNRVLNNQNTPANALMMQRFRLFDLEGSKTGIPALRKKLNEATTEYLSAHFLRRMESHVRKEVDGVVEFFRRQRLGAELQLAGQAAAYHEIRKHVEVRVSEILASTEGSERHLGQIKSDFQKKAAEILTMVQGEFERALEPNRMLWNLLQWNTLRAVGRKRGQHTTSNGIEIYVQGDLAEIYSEELRATWVRDRDRLIDAICGDHLNELVHRIQRVIDEGKGFALGKDPQTTAFVEQQMGDFAEKAALQLTSLREEFRKRTESYESLRAQLIPEVGELLMPTFIEIGSEYGSGCGARMRGYLRRGLDGSLQTIHQKVHEKVASNWELFIQEAVDHTTIFVKFIRDWLAALNQVPEGTGDGSLELRQQRAEELERMLRDPSDEDSMTAPARGEALCV